MAKILLVIAVFAAVYLIVRSYVRALAAKHAAEPATKSPEDMVRCAHCGVHLPRSDSIDAGDRAYCCAEHRQLDLG